MDKNKLKNLFSKDNKKLKSDLMTVFAIGILLIILGNTFFSSNLNKEPPIDETAQINNEKPFSQNTDQKNMEIRLEEIFSKVEGAGEVKVMVTTINGSEIIVAEDTKKVESTTTESGQQGDKRIIESNNYENTVVMMENSDGSNKPLIIKEVEPKVEGVVIVAQGGDNIVVKDALSKAAQALLNVPAHKIEILKMK